MITSPPPPPPPKKKKKIFLQLLTYSVIASSIKNIYSALDHSPHPPSSLFTGRFPPLPLPYLTCTYRLLWKYQFCPGRFRPSPSPCLTYHIITGYLGNINSALDDFAPPPALLSYNYWLLGKYQLSPGRFPPPPPPSPCLTYHIITGYLGNINSALDNPPLPLPYSPYNCRLLWEYRFCPATTEP